MRRRSDALTLDPVNARRHRLRSRVPQGRDGAAAICPSRRRPACLPSRVSTAQRRSAPHASAGLPTFPSPNSRRRGRTAPGLPDARRHAHPAPAASTRRPAGIPHPAALPLRVSATASRREAGSSRRLRRRTKRTGGGARELQRRLGGKWRRHGTASGAWRCRREER
uniref:Uncharacterized protein n=1 Tax=Oryza glumipatula TaxID=40148 RepID=A0A0E0AB45_9ORYZ